MEELYVENADFLKNPLDNQLIMNIIMKYFEDDFQKLVSFRKMNSTWNLVATTYLTKKVRENLQNCKFESDSDLDRFLSTFNESNLMHVSFILNIPNFQLIDQNQVFLQFKLLTQSTMKCLDIKNYVAMNKSMWNYLFVSQGGINNLTDPVCKEIYQNYHEQSKTNRIGIKKFRRLFIEDFPQLSHISIREVDYTDNDQIVFHLNDKLNNLTKFHYHVEKYTANLTGTKLTNEFFRIAKNINELEISFRPFKNANPDTARNFFLDTFTAIQKYKLPVTTLKIHCTNIFEETLVVTQNRGKFQNILMTKIVLIDLWLNNYAKIFNFLRITTGALNSLIVLNISYRCQFIGILDTVRYLPLTFPNLKILSLEYLDTKENMAIKISNEYFIKIYERFPQIEELTLKNVTLSGAIQLRENWNSIKKIELKTVIMDLDVSEFFLFFESIRIQNLTDLTIGLVRGSSSLSKIISFIFGIFISIKEAKSFLITCSYFDSTIGGPNGTIKKLNSSSCKEFISNEQINTFDTFQKPLSNMTKLYLIEFPITIEDETTLKSLHEFCPNLENLSIYFQVFSTNPRTGKVIKSKLNFRRTIPETCIVLAIVHLSYLKNLSSLTMEFDGAIENFDRCFCAKSTEELDKLKSKNKNPELLLNISIRNLLKLEILIIKWKFGDANLGYIPQFLSKQKSEDEFYITDKGVNRTFKKMGNFNCLILKIQYNGGLKKKTYEGMKDVFSNITVAKEISYEETSGVQSVFTKIHKFY